MLTFTTRQAPYDLGVGKLTFRLLSYPAMENLSYSSP